MHNQKLKGRKFLEKHRHLKVGSLRKAMPLALGYTKFYVNRLKANLKRPNEMVNLILFLSIMLSGRNVVYCNEKFQKKRLIHLCHARENSLSNKSSKFQFIISLGFHLAFSLIKCQLNKTKLNSFIYH